MLCEIKPVFSRGYLRDKGVHASLAFSSIYGLWLSLVERLVREQMRTRRTPIRAVGLHGNHANSRALIAPETCADSIAD
jgi:hypothetical protein